MKKFVGYAFDTFTETKVGSLLVTVVLIPFAVVLVLFAGKGLATMDGDN